MSLEKIQTTLQTWPTTFQDKFKRKLKKSEILAAMENKLQELESENVRVQFLNYTAMDLMEAIEYVNSGKFDMIEDESFFAKKVKK